MAEKSFRKRRFVLRPGIKKSLQKEGYIIRDQYGMRFTSGFWNILRRSLQPRWPGIRREAPSRRGPGRKVHEELPGHPALSRSGRRVQSRVRLRFRKSVPSIPRLWKLSVFPIWQVCVHRYFLLFFWEIQVYDTDPGDSRQTLPSFRTMGELLSISTLYSSHLRSKRYCFA